jgi:hypothetical protein
LGARGLPATPKMANQPLVITSGRVTITQHKLKEKAIEKLYSSLD